MEICKNQVPEVKDMGNGHKVRCQDVYKRQVPVFAEDADAAEDTADAAEETEGGSSDTPLVVGQTNFSEKFCGMFAEAVPDQQISDIVGAYLFDNDRAGAVIYNGIEGETTEYNGTELSLIHI